MKVHSDCTAMIEATSLSSGSSDHPYQSNARCNTESVIGRSLIPTALKITYYSALNKNSH